MLVIVRQERITTEMGWGGRSSPEGSTEKVTSTQISEERGRKVSVLEKTVLSVIGQK